MGRLTYSCLVASIERDGLYVEGQYWELVDARFDVTEIGDWTLEARTRGPGRPDGETWFILPGHVDPPPRSVGDLLGKRLVFTPEDSGDMMPFWVASVSGSLTALAGACLEVVALGDGVGTFAYDGPFEWLPDDGDVEERHVLLRVQARVQLRRRAAPPS